VKFLKHKVFFCNSGGEANENALKIALKATGRDKIVAYSGAFHGRTTMAIGATDNSNWHDWFSAWMGPSEHITPNDEAGLSLIDDSTAAVILEPIQSIGGVTEFQIDYLKALRARCNKVGAKLIFDEVQTGMGRTGVPFVSTGWGIAPDMCTLAKGLGGGFPMGAVIVTNEVASTVNLGDVAATFGGGPLAMAAMLAVIETIEEENLIENACKIEAYVREKFQIPEIIEIRGKGCLLGLVLDREFPPIQQGLFKKGIITGPNANKNLLHLLPPLTVQPTHFDALAEALSELLRFPVGE